MLQLFSADKKFQTWRELWVALAESERALGLNITNEQIEELRFSVHDINYDVANSYEAKLKHDVMAHIKAYGEQCQTAKGIIHLGATSAYVVDNTDLIIIRDGLDLIERQLMGLIASLASFAEKYAATPTVAFTHFQPAQFTSVGKRACLWIQDLLLDLQEVRVRKQNLRFLGVKGTTGTQASFLTLFNNDEIKVKTLDLMVAHKMGFSDTYMVSGQTYSRKIDAQIQATLSGIAESAHKFANDMRLLQHLREIQEPFGKDQVGSSAMAYKRNPMKSERITSLARLVISLNTNAAFTAASQWFERTLDDSAGKRIALPEAFLGVDAILQLYMSIISGIVVNSEIINAHVLEELPDIASENLLMEAVKAGGDRQELHETIRRHKMSGVNLLEALQNEAEFRAVWSKVSTQPAEYIGRSASQVIEFLNSPLLLEVRQSNPNIKSEVRV
jgi:adenylosuccinate lyase